MVHGPGQAPGAASGGGAAQPPPPPPSLGAVAAAIAEAATHQLGCAKCRYSRGGCARCRSPKFTPRLPPGGAALGAAAAPAAGSNGAAQLPATRPPRRTVKGKRQRNASAEQTREGEPLVQALRRQLEELHAQSSASTGTLPGAADGAAAAAGGHATTAGGRAAVEAGAAPAAPAAQQQKRSAEAAPAGRPAKSLKADPQLVSNQQQQAQHAQQEEPQSQQHPTALAAASKRGASAEPSPTSRRPSKRRRAGSVPPAPGQPAASTGAAAAAPEAPDAAMQQAGAAGKRPAAAEQQLRPAKFRRVAPPELQAAQQAPPPAALQQEQQQQRQGGAAATPRDRRKQQQRQAEAGMGSPEGAAGMDMDIDMVSPRKRAAAAALERHATAGGATSPATADFLARLGENMQLRHQERQAGAEPHPLLGLSAAKRRRSTSHPAGSSPSAPSPAAGTAQQAQQEADPRLCLWEPPVSPYGLLEEELYDDPWKLLVACMLLNKTSGAQVRKVIWELFSLCPTPAAAIAADVQQVQNLIQPLGLFRKRALAIQQLSHEYLYKVWRDPTELYGIGKYAADAYLMFSRGRWREVQPDDKDLKRYHEWLESTGGLGTGLTRHRTVPPAAAAAAQQ